MIGTKSPSNAEPVSGSIRDNQAHSIEDDDCDYDNDFEDNDKVDDRYSS